MIVECPHCKEKVDVPQISPETKTTCPKCQGEIGASDFWTGSPAKSNYRTSKIICIIIFIVILALIVIPNYIRLRTQQHDASAKSAGRNAKLSQEVGFDTQHDDPCFGYKGDYQNELSDLLSFDKNLTDDAEVTFTFGECNCTGYTFTTQHARGTETYLFTD